MPRRIRYVATIGVLIVTPALAACSSVRISNESYEVDFSGRFVVTERSSEKLISLTNVELRLVLGHRGVINLTTATGMSWRYVHQCELWIGRWDSAFRSPDEGQDYHGLSCIDEFGVHWHFLHAAPGATSITPLFARITQHDVRSESGYLVDAVFCCRDKEVSA